jgi:hypothetical protein
VPHHRALARLARVHRFHPGASSTAASASCVYLHPRTLAIKGVKGFNRGDLKSTLDWCIEKLSR